jgi:dTMP kinase
VILNTEPAILTERLATRGAHSRFERHPDGPATESALYKDTAARLTHLDWAVCSIDSTHREPTEIAAIVTARILTLYTGHRSEHGNNRPVPADPQHR